MVKIIINFTLQGKFSESFQQLKPTLRQNWWGEIHHRNYDIRHDSLGFILWEDQRAIRKLLNIQSNLYRKTLKIWFQAVTGHHGLPPKNNQNGNKVLSKNYFRTHDVETVAMFFNASKNLFNVKDIDLTYITQSETCEERQKQAS